MMFARAAGRNVLTILVGAFVCFVAFEPTNVGVAHDGSSSVSKLRRAKAPNERGHPYHLRFSEFVIE